jgi:hypothetical protein
LTNSPRDRRRSGARFLYSACGWQRRARHQSNRDLQSALNPDGSSAENVEALSGIAKNISAHLPTTEPDSLLNPPARMISDLRWKHEIREES